MAAALHDIPLTSGPSATSGLATALGLAGPTPRCRPRRAVHRRSDVELIAGGERIALGAEADSRVTVMEAPDPGCPAASAPCRSSPDDPAAGGRLRRPGCQVTGRTRSGRREGPYRTTRRELLSRRDQLTALTRLLGQRRHGKPARPAGHWAGARRRTS